MTKQGDGSGSMKTTTSLKQGTTRSASFPDKSMGLPRSPSVNQDAVRSETAPTPKTIGDGRVA